MRYELRNRPGAEVPEGVAGPDRGPRRGPIDAEHEVNLMRRRLCAGTLAAVMLAASLCLGIALPAQAWGKEKTYRLGTYIGSAATIYALTKGKGTWALIGGGATLLSYNQWRKEAKRRRARDRSARAYSAYRADWLRRHR